MIHKIWTFKEIRENVYSGKRARPIKEVYGECIIEVYGECIMEVYGECIMEVYGECIMEVYGECIMEVYGEVYGNDKLEIINLKW